MERRLEQILTQKSSMKNLNPWLRSQKRDRYKSSGLLIKILVQNSGLGASLRVLFLGGSSEPLLAPLQVLLQQLDAPVQGRHLSLSLHTRGHKVNQGGHQIKAGHYVHCDSIVDPEPDPKGSVTYCWILIRKIGLDLDQN